LRGTGYKNTVELGDIYNISKIHSNVPLIMGLSSWDSCYNLEDSMNEVYKSLSENGVFIHIQDLFPAKDVVLGREWKRRSIHGWDKGFIEYKCYTTDEWCVVGIKSIVFGWISSILHFLIEMGDTCRKVGFKEVDWGYMEGNFIGEKLSVHKEMPNKNVFLRKDTDYKCMYDNNLPEDFVREKIEFLTLTAKK
jgi:hypothetical protein